MSRLLFVAFGRVAIFGAENVPAHGGVILASNHLSNADPNLVGSSILRPIFYFAKEELFRQPILGWVLTQVNAFPVKRKEHDVGAFKKAQSLLAAGHGVLLFPEGRRSKTGELGRAKAGVGMLAYKAGVPVVPVCVVNSHRLFRFKKLKVAFGKPLHPKKDPQGRQSYQAFSDEIMAAIADLKLKM